MVHTSPHYDDLLSAIWSAGLFSSIWGSHLSNKYQKMES